MQKSSENLEIFQGILVKVLGKENISIECSSTVQRLRDGIDLATRVKFRRMRGVTLASRTHKA